MGRRGCGIKGGLYIAGVVAYNKKRLGSFHIWYFFIFIFIFDDSSGIKGVEPNV